MSNIHPSAIVGQNVKIGKDVTIGPFCVIEGDVTIGDNTSIASHVSIKCKTIIGKNVKVFPFVSIDISQDLKYMGEDSWVEIGDNTVLREYVTVNNGSHYDQNKTTIGKNCLLMIGVHVAHDCILGDNVIIANNTLLGGHVTVESNVVIGGMVAVHPKVRIGKGAIIGGMSGVASDIIPYGHAKNERATLHGLNLVGMKRSNIARADINEMNMFFDDLFMNNQQMFNERLNTLAKKYQHNSHIMYIIKFISQDKKRTICMPKKTNLNSKPQDEK